MDEALPALIAHNYYILGKSRSRIADECGLSRWQVARLLRKAHWNGTVRVEIRLPLGIDDVLSANLAAALGFPVIVVNHADCSESSLADRLRRVTADLLAGLVVPKDDVVGIIAGPILQALDGRNIDVGHSATVQMIPWQESKGLARDRFNGVCKLVVELQRGMEFRAHDLQRSMGFSGREQLSSPTVLGVACGAANSSTVRAAIQHRFIDALVIDSSVAERLLLLTQKTSPPIADRKSGDGVTNVEGRADLRRGHG
jgi:DNA-binding transcriptional regulator LsrR (DeoR family)